MKKSAQNGKFRLFPGMSAGAAIASLTLVFALVFSACPSPTEPDGGKLPGGNGPDEAKTGQISGSITFTNIPEPAPKVYIRAMEHSGGWSSYENEISFGKITGVSETVNWTIPLYKEHAFTGQKQVRFSLRVEDGTLGGYAIDIDQTKTLNGLTANVGSLGTVSLDTEPDPDAPVPLSANTWVNGTITPATADGYDSYSISVAAGQTYYLWWNDGNEGDGQKTLDVLVSAEYLDGASIPLSTDDSAWDNPSEFTASSGGTVIIKVRPREDGGSGTYAIAYSTGSDKPGSGGGDWTPPARFTTLTADTWAEGSIATSSGEQWFQFTATAATQYIHASFGTLTGGLYVELYDSAGDTVKNQSLIFPAAGQPYISSTVTNGQVYYITVWPYSSDSGTYQIGYTTSHIPPGSTTLTADTWANGNIPQATSPNSNIVRLEWFKFTATADTQYIHVKFNTLTMLKVQVFDSMGMFVRSQVLYGSSTYTSSTVTNGQVYYITVGPESNYDAGTYQITFSVGRTPPGSTLTADTWANGNIPTSNSPTSYGEQWFKFTATGSSPNSTQFIHVSFGTLTSLNVQVYDSTGAVVQLYDRVGNTTTSLSLSGSDARATIQATSAQVYYIRVSASNSGAYQIAFNTSIIPPGVSPATLTVNTWANGNIPTSDGVQWFQFTATTDKAYVYVTFGTLSNLYMELYGSTGAVVGYPALAGSGTSGSTSCMNNSLYSMNVTAGEAYYIRIRPYSSSYSGDYQIAFNTDIAPPGYTTLNTDTWAGGTLPSNGEEWFAFTATASTQYIHASFGTLDDLWVQLYYSSGSKVAINEQHLAGSARSTSITVTNGQVYYIRIRPNSSSGSGTYKIACSANSNPPSIQLPNSATLLYADIWTSGTIPVNGEQWFQFTATAATQYIHASFGTLTDLNVQLYNSDGFTAGSETLLNSSATYTGRTVSDGQVYYIRVWPDSSSSSGDYQIGFKTNFIPLGYSATTLNTGTWAGGTLPSNGEQWFTFTATTTGEQYIHASFGTLDEVRVQLYHNTGYTVGIDERLGGSSRYINRTVSYGDVYYIRVRPYPDSGSGDYQITFNTSLIPPGGSVTVLNPDTWASGTFSSSEEQWFSFTATAATQYIHASFGTLPHLYVQLYNSGGTMVGSPTHLYSGTLYTSRTVTSTQMYYIKVWPDPSFSSGDFQIAFNTSSTPPPNS
jgi:predicted RNA-binding protein with TRAM domain